MKTYKRKHIDLPHRSDPNYEKLYYEKHKEKLKENHRKYCKKRYEENPDIYKGKYDPEKRAKWMSIEKNFIREKERNWRNRGIDITYDKYLEELKKQDGKCKICGQLMDKPHVDHDHNTGKYRGILCSPCNTGLGKYEKYKELFEEYLTDAEDYGDYTFMLVKKEDGPKIS